MSSRPFVHPSIVYTQRKFQKQRRGTIEINGARFPMDIIRECMVGLLSRKAMAVMGPSGYGKTFMAEHAFKSLLENYFDTEFEYIYLVLSYWKNPADAFVRPVISGGDLVWGRGPLVIKSEEAIKRNVPILIIIDEFNRLNSANQNLLLKMCEVGRVEIHLEQTNERLTLPENSKVVCIGNPGGHGTFPVNEALKDRLVIVKYPLPSEEQVVDMLWQQYEKLPMQDSSKSVFGVDFYERPVSKVDVELLTQAMFELNDCRKPPASIRELISYIDVFRFAKNKQMAVDMIITRIENSVDSTEPKVRRKIDAVSDILQNWGAGI